MGLTRRSLVVAGLAASGAAGLGAAIGRLTRNQATKALVVADGTGDDRLLEHPVENGDSVVLAYTHSVEKTPVEDRYVVDEDRLRMTGTWFQSHGAGLPADEPIERVDDGFLVERATSHERLHVAVGETAGHELVVGGDRHDLLALGAPSVVLSVESRNEHDSRLERPLRRVESPPEGRGGPAEGAPSGALDARGVSSGLGNHGISTASNGHEPSNRPGNRS